MKRFTPKLLLVLMLVIGAPQARTMGIFPRRSPTPTATPTPTIGPSDRSPTPTASPLSTPRALHGVIELVPGGDRVTGNEPGWTSNCTGERFRGDWASAEPVEGAPDFSLLDKFIDAAKAHPDKLTGISYRAGDAFPPWLEAAGAKLVTLRGTQVALPWDTVVAQKFSAFVNRLAAHCASKNFKPDYVVLGNIGKALTTGLAETPDDIALLDSLGGLAAWGTNADAMTALYAQVFDTNIIVAAAAAPYLSSEGNQALQDFVDRMAAKYPRFGPMHTALRFPVENPGKPYQLLTQYCKTSHPTGLQFVNAVIHPLPKPPPVCKTPSDTCYADALGVAVNYKVNFVETYSQDDTPDNQPAIAQANADLR
jgi:hypothetical protein